MTDEMVVRHCSPTLAGLKTGSLFACQCPSKRELCASLNSLNTRLKHKGIRIIPLKFTKDRALVYMFRPDMLRRDLSCDMAEMILQRSGYESVVPSGCLRRLIRRLSDNSSFPHEIGLFLGYPAEDVKGFIENRAACCKCAGCWKVYGDVKSAKRKFAKYRKCTDVYCKTFKKGCGIERLAVAV